MLNLSFFRQYLSIIFLLYGFICLIHLASSFDEEIKPFPGYLIMFIFFFFMVDPVVLVDPITKTCLFKYT